MVAMSAPTARAAVAPPLRKECIDHKTLVKADVRPDCAVAGIAAVEKHELDDDASRRSKRSEIVGWRGQASEKNVPDNLGGNGFAQVTVRMSVALELAEAFTSLADEVAESWLFEAAVSVCGVDGRKVWL